MKEDETMKQFGDWLVLGSAGVDVDATVAAFRSDLEASKDAQAETYVKVASLVTQVLNENKGTRTNMDFVTGTVARLMGATAANHSETKKLVGDYIRANASGEKDGKPINSKTGEILAAPRTFFVGKGPGGGVAFWADRIAEKA
jgi:hypothetical protein